MKERLGCSKYASELLTRTVRNVVTADTFCRYVCVVRSRGSKYIDAHVTIFGAGGNVKDYEYSDSETDNRRETR